MKALLACLLFAVSAIGQDMALSQYPPTVRVLFTSPSGVTCSAGQVVLYAAAVTTIWTCQNGVFIQTSGGGGSSIAPFTTDGTNVTLPSGTFSVGNPLPQASPQVGDVNFKGTLYQNGVLFSGGGGSGYSCTSVAGDLACAHAGGNTINSQSITGGSSTSSYITVTVGTSSGFYVGAPVTISGASPAGYNMVGTVGNGGVVTAIVSTTQVRYASTANPGAWSSGGTISLTCGNSAGDAITVSPYTFAATSAVAANFFGGSSANGMGLIGQFRVWSGASPPVIHDLDVYFNSQKLYASATLGPNASQPNLGGSLGWLLVANPASTGIISEPYGAALPLTSTVQNYYNTLGQPVVPSAMTLPAALSLSVAYTATGIGPATCNTDANTRCGLTTLSCSTGQTVNLGTFNGASCNAAATATVACTGTDQIADGTPITITNTGYACTAVSTAAAKVAGGTATATGSVAITMPALGGAQGNAIALESLCSRK